MITLDLESIRARFATLAENQFSRDALALVAEVERLQFESDVMRASLRRHEAEVARLTAALAEAERYRDAYKRAKSENDERFMRERDKARHELAAAESALADYRRNYPCPRGCGTVREPKADDVACPVCAGVGPEANPVKPKRAVCEPCDGGGRVRCHCGDTLCPGSKVCSDCRGGGVVDIEAARAFVACKGWTWLPGMVAEMFDRSGRGECLFRVRLLSEWGFEGNVYDLDDCEVCGPPETYHQVPDLSDPLTRAGLLCVVRIAWDMPALYVESGDPDPDGVTWWSVPRRFVGRTGIHRSEALALLAALHAAPAAKGGT